MKLYFGVTLGHETLARARERAILEHQKVVWQPGYSPPFCLDTNYVRSHLRKNQFGTNGGNGSDRGLRSARLGKVRNVSDPN